MAPVTAVGFCGQKQPKYSFSDNGSKGKNDQRKIFFKMVYHMTLFEKVDFRQTCQPGEKQQVAKIAYKKSCPRVGDGQQTVFGSVDTQ